MNIWKHKNKNNQHMETLIRHGTLAPKRYRCSEIKKMTNSFQVKLGQGGYGSVYKGRLPNNRLVAVKILNTSYNNGEEFINEVVSISRTSHVNIVSLLGFCFEGQKKALIYEYMANGSLEKFIYNPGAHQHLGWRNLYQIAIGIARGLEYLHRGCNTRILHFDIKPHNVLLDEDMCPKISDFGLAKLCSKKESIISMQDARGTIGYMAPEVYFMNSGTVSHKSDVYSYGMMVLEMVGGRKNVDVAAEKTSRIYFPWWVHERLQQGSSLELKEVKNNEENEIAEKMVLVALWCIQPNPNDRPSITEVIEMLEGSIDALEVPPKVSVYSPSILQINDESNTVINHHVTR